MATNEVILKFDTSQLQWLTSTLHALDERLLILEQRVLPKANPEPNVVEITTHADYPNRVYRVEAVDGIAAWRDVGWCWNKCKAVRGELLYDNGTYQSVWKVTITPKEST